MLQQNYQLHSSLPFTPKQSRTPFQTPQNDLIQQQRHFRNDSTSEEEDKFKKNGKKHTEEEGFSLDQEEQQPVVMVKKQQILNCTVSSHQKKFIPYRIKQPKIKLTFISKQPKQQQPLSATLKREYNNKSLEMKKTTGSKPLIFNPENLINLCVIKLKRNFIGDNLVYQHYGVEENKMIKAEIVQKGNKIVYEIGRQSSTYGHLSLLKDKFHKRNNQSNQINMKKEGLRLTQRDQRISSAFGFNINQNKKQDNFFLESSTNQLLKTKHKDSFIYHKRRQVSKQQKQEIQFDGEFQSANLQIVSRVINSSQLQNKDSQNLEYNLYLRNDTNTRGHQNWFYFSMKNNNKQKKRVKLNIMNLKRNLNLVKQGQRIYVRTISPVSSQWQVAGQNVQIRQNKNTNVYRSKVRMLSFQLDLLPQTEYEVSLLPPFTYSEMLKDVQQLKDCAHARVDTLTYSLIGMAIPIVTFTNFDVQDTNKEVILISARIHPGQTNSSYIIKGLIQALKELKNSSSQIEDFLNSTIIKIIPMINPDGVVFGNFRTNYLGYDLNRSFHTDDQVTNPQITSLKELGKKLKRQHGQKFNTFIDIHGHSSQKNIFTYGPDFQNGNQKFYKARLLPKVLNSKSPYFKYSSCTFKLQQYKLNTARGFFLNTLNVTAFTIESSYAVYETQNGKNQILTPKQWIIFGQNLLECFQLIHRLNKTHNIKNRTQLKRAISLTEEQHIQLLNTLKKQMRKQQKIKKSKKPQQLIKSQEDSDGEDEKEDLDPIERDEIQKKLVENSAKNYILPKVFKPSILYPTVTPKLFNIGENDFSNYKILYTRRNRYHSIKMPNNNYLHSLQGMQNFKPKVRNIKVEKKIEFV